MIFRSDIQILRGLACIHVVIFHLNLPLSENGYLGVDVFFVISGFLMAILYRNANNAVEYWTKRACRILPAYYTVLVATVVGGFLFTSPNETNQLITQAYFGTVFSSNVGFWLQNSYFNKAEFNPLLHYWSLAIELQFYAIVPLLFLLKNKLKPAIPLALIGSLATCFIVTTISPKTSFFLLPFRIWEFLIGYLCAIYATTNGAPKTKLNILSIAGLLILLSIPLLKIDTKAANFIFGHPGLSSLLISIATCTILALGLPRALEYSFLGRALAFVGKYSYSLYLVHFPIIVIFNSSPFSGTVTSPSNGTELLTIAILITTATALLFHLVEYRRPSSNIIQQSVYLTFGILAICVCLPFLQNSSISQKEQQIFNAFSDRTTYRCGKLHRILHPSSTICQLYEAKHDSDLSVMLVGNSHADSIKTTFKAAAIANNKSLFFVVSNNPLKSKKVTPRRIIASAIDHEISHIVLHYSPASIPIASIAQLTSLAERHGIRISFIDPVPVWPAHIPRQMHIEYNNKNTPKLTQSASDYLEFNKSIFSKLEDISNRNFNRYQVAEYFCQQNCIYHSPDGKPYYFDRGHLTLTGSDVLIELFNDILSD